MLHLIKYARNEHQHWLKNNNVDISAALTKNIFPNREHMSLLLYLHDDDSSKSHVRNFSPNQRKKRNSEICNVMHKT